MERWENGRSELILCKHHANRHRDALVTGGRVRTEAWRFELTTRVVKSQSRNRQGQIETEEDHIRGLIRVREV